MNKTIKPLGPGVTYSTETKKYIAKLGIKTLGQYNTLYEAAKNYNETAQRIFSFPILNRNYIEPEILQNTKHAVKESLKKEQIESTKIIEPIIEQVTQDIPILDKVMDTLKNELYKTS